MDLLINCVFLVLSVLNSKMFWTRVSTLFLASLVAPQEHNGHGHMEGEGFWGGAVPIEYVVLLRSDYYPFLFKRSFLHRTDYKIIFIYYILRLKMFSIIIFIIIIKYGLKKI